MLLTQSTSFVSNVMQHALIAPVQIATSAPAVLMVDSLKLAQAVVNWIVVLSSGIIIQGMYARFATQAA
jgi:hypothetical protein